MFPWISALRDSLDPRNCVCSRVDTLSLEVEKLSREVTVMNGLERRGVVLKIFSKI